MVKAMKQKSKLGPIVIIGNGMVSWRLCRSLVELGVHERRSILVFGDEIQPAYDRVNLTKYFELEKSDDLLLSNAEWYASHDIALHIGRKIIRLDPQQKLVVDDQGQEYAYADCVLATGSRAFVPPIEGAANENVFVYRTIEDIEAIKAAAQGARRGLVIGGGLLGLEAANVLKDLGLETCVVQAASGLMSRQLNEDGSGYLLREVAALGMSVRLRTNTQRIQKTATKLEVEFNHGDPLEVDLVIIAAGIRPRDELAEEAGLQTAARGGFIVDDHLETKVGHVYAIGECASHRGEVYGLVAPGYEMADCLAQRLASKKNARYRGSDSSCRLKLLGVEVGTFGDYLQEGVYHVHRGARSYRSLVFRRSKLIGATVIGDWSEIAEIERAVKEGRTFSKGMRRHFERTGDLFGESMITSVIHWPDTAIVCNCTRTSCGTLREAVGAGCLTVAALTERTGAGGVCGSCMPQLADFVGEDVGQVLDVARPKGGMLLMISAIIALIVCLGFILGPPVPAAKTVQSTYYEFTQIWQDSFTKKVTGYTIAGLSLFAILLSARKRFRWLNFGNYGFWRAAHSWLGVTTLLGIFFHTGLNFGENLNFWLLICFLGLNLAGGLAAIAVAAEKRFSGPVGARLRGVATKAHIVFFLPYPVLLGFHIAKVYLY